MRNINLPILNILWSMVKNIERPGPRPAKGKSHDILQISWHLSHDIGFPSHKANLMTFCVKFHDINLMTLGRWHSTKNWILVKVKENNHNTCVLNLLNGIDRHFLLIKMFLVCLKINMRHSKKHWCGNLPTSTCDVTMHVMVVPYSSNVCENSLVQWNVWIHRLPRENVSTMSSVLVGHNLSSVDILLTFMLCQCNVLTLLNNLSGTGARWLRVLWIINFCHKWGDLLILMSNSVIGEHYLWQTIYHITSYILFLGLKHMENQEKYHWLFSLFYCPLYGWLH